MVKSLKDRIQSARFFMAQLNTLKGHGRQGSRRVEVAQPRAKRNLTVYRRDGSIKRSHAEEVARLATEKAR